MQDQRPEQNFFQIISWPIFIAPEAEQLRKLSYYIIQNKVIREEDLMEQWAKES